MSATEYVWLLVSAERHVMEPITDSTDRDRAMRLVRLVSSVVTEAIHDRGDGTESKLFSSLTELSALTIEWAADVVDSELP